MRLKTKRKINFYLLCGILGCVCMGIGGWLMLYGDTAYRGSLSWMVIVSEMLMLPPHIYWLWMLVRDNSVFPKGMALSNPLAFYVFLKLLTMLMPDRAFRLAFTNGLMSESMLLWFGSMLLWNLIHKNNFLEENDGKY